MGSSSKNDKKDKDKNDTKDKKDKKDKKRSESDGIKKPKSESKKDKKSRHEKLAAAVEEQVKVAVIVPTTAEEEKKSSAPTIVGAALPIALPIADDKGTKKILRTIRKAAKSSALKRGVKEVTKAVRKSPAASPSNTAFPGVVVLAGDIWPMDVISHLPVACEDHNIPYIYVRSRAELGDSAATKRPTSVVMVMETPGKKNKTQDQQADDDESYGDKYKSLVKLIKEETIKQSFW